MIVRRNKVEKGKTKRFKSEVKNKIIDMTASVERTKRPLQFNVPYPIHT